MTFHTKRKPNSNIDECYVFPSYFGPKEFKNEVKKILSPLSPENPYKITSFLCFFTANHQFNFEHYDNDEDIFTTPNLSHDKLLRNSVYFDKRYIQNVTTIAGQTAFLNCRVRNIGKKTVSWVRHRDINLLSVGKDIYSSDERFVALHNKETGDWTLQIKYANRKDTGAYECQVSTTPPIGTVLYLQVVDFLTQKPQRKR
uniref:Ig-like domain-containing protein n=1 Tax=Megaselia scalaris TaxID=36166 RepID=T1GK33_MEGSC